MRGREILLSSSGSFEETGFRPRELWIRSFCSTGELGEPSAELVSGVGTRRDGDRKISRRMVGLSLEKCFCRKGVERYGLPTCVAWPEKNSLEMPSLF